MDSSSLSTSWLINIGMDGPTLNQSFLKQFKIDFKESEHSLIDIGSCPLHVTNNSFKFLLNILKPSIDLDSVATDLHFFFKRSAAQRGYYKIVESISKVTTHYMKKHVESC